MRLQRDAAKRRAPEACRYEGGRMKYVIAFCIILATATFADTNVMIDAINDGGITWSSSHTNGTFTVEWVGSPTNEWASGWSDKIGIPATGGSYTVTAPFYFRIRYDGPRTNGPLIEDFEDAGGWSNHPEGDWTQIANSGEWKATSAAALTNSVFARSGVRYIAISFSDFDFPPVDNPTQLIVRTRGVLPSSSYGMSLRFFDGATWQQYSTKTASGNTYTSLVWDIDLGYPNPQQRLRIATFDSFYLDDVEIKTKD